MCDSYLSLFKIRLQLSKRSNSQNGSLLLEFIIVSTLVLMVAVWSINEWVERTKTLQANALAAWMSMAQDGVQAYLEQEHLQIITAMQDNSEHGAKIDWQALKDKNYLTSAWSNAGPMHKQLDYKLNLIGDCQLEPCILQALVYSTEGLLDKNNNPDQSMIADWLTAVAGKGLVVWQRNPNLFKGAGVSVPINAASNIQLGAIGLLATKNITKLKSDEEQENAQPNNDGDYLRVFDKRDPEFQGALTVAGDIRANANLEIADSIVIESSYQPFQACNSEGAISHNANYPSLLVCKNGQWQQSRVQAGGGYIINTKSGCKNSFGQSTANPRTNECSCPPMYTSVQVSEGGSVTDPNGLNMGYICEYFN